MRKINASTQADAPGPEIGDNSESSLLLFICIYTLTGFAPFFPFFCHQLLPTAPARSILQPPRSMPLFIRILLVLATAAASHAAENRIPRPSLVVGTQSIGAKYKFSDSPLLVESARQIHRMGSDILKIAVTPKYQDDYMMEKDPEIRSLLDLFQRKPEFAEVCGMSFPHLQLWIYPFSDTRSAFRLGHVPEAEARQVYQEIYDFTAYLLKTYSGSGKSFYLGNWEGDWHLQEERYDHAYDPNETAIRGAIDWFNLRSKAVADARRDTPHEGVQVFFYIEINHVRKALTEDRPALVNRVLPHIDTDYVSWSSYDITKEAAKRGGEEGKKMVMDALNYIEAHLPPSDLPGKRVMIGEYGFENASAPSPQLQARYSADLIRWGLEWGCPFILYWQLYCNEIDAKTRRHRGYWLIDDRGEEQPVWHLFTGFLEKARAFGKNFEGEFGRRPTQAEFNRVASTWLINPDELWEQPRAAR